jgi:hypothetical protein
MLMHVRPAWCSSQFSAVRLPTSQTPQASSRWPPKPSPLDSIQNVSDYVHLRQHSLRPVVRDA